jgi:predicted kinase
MRPQPDAATAAVTSPTLVVVSGPPGSGKTTLAHGIARALGCPAVCRDEIKEGMAHATPGYAPHPGDALSWRTLTTFFDMLTLLVTAGVTVVAEAAFQDKLWRPGLEPLADLAAIRIVHCVLDPAVARARMARRIEQEARRAAHDDHHLLQAQADAGNPPGAFVPLALPVPALHVDTTAGYRPDIPDILAFIDHRQEE